MAQLPSRFKKTIIDIFQIKTDGFYPNKVISIDFKKEVEKKLRSYLFT
jgi:hypothetical protein